MGETYEDYEKDEWWTVKGIFFDASWHKASPGSVLEGQEELCQGTCDTPMNTPLNVRIFSDDISYQNSEGVQYVYDVIISVHFSVKKEPKNEKLYASILTPLPKKSVRGLEDITTMTSLAHDDDPIVKMEYYVDGNLILTDTAEPFTCVWDTATVPDGNHTLTVKAYDAADRTATSEPVTVKVSNSTLPAGVSFVDTDRRRNVLGGSIVITKAPDEGLFDSYALYWGNPLGTRVGGEAAIAVLAKTGTDLNYTLPADTPRPAGASCVLLFTKTGTELGAGPASCAFEDLWEDRVYHYNAADELQGVDATCYSRYGDKVKIKKYDGTETLTSYTTYEYNEAMKPVMVKDYVGGILQGYRTTTYDNWEKPLLIRNSAPNLPLIPA